MPSSPTSRRAHCTPGHHGAAQLIDAIKAWHRPIARYFHSGVGLELQNIDAGMAGRDQWVAGAKVYDQAIAAAVREKLEDEMVAGTVVHVIKLRELAELVIQKVLDATKATSDAVDLGALRPSLGLAHDALDKSEVLTGGVSDRQEGKAAPQKWDHLFDGLHGRDKSSPVPH